MFLDVEKLFVDRADAGRKLATALMRFRREDVLVLAIPRGGLPVGAAVAQALAAELDVIVARKLGAPGHEELAIGAVTADGTRYLHENTLAMVDVLDSFLSGATRAQVAEARAREKRFRAGRPAPRVRARTVIVVDDGVATGSTMIVALRALRRQRPARLICAVPVGSPGTLKTLRGECDEVVCLEAPEAFFAVGQFYEEFLPVSDEEVIDILHRVRHRSGTPIAAP